MNRREFITLLGGAAALWPTAARAQQPERMRRIGMLDITEETDRRAQDQWDAMRDTLAKLGWVEGRNVQYDRRYSAHDPDRLRTYADELVRLAPDVIAVASGPAAQ